MFNVVINLSWKNYVFNKSKSWKIKRIFELFALKLLPDHIKNMFFLKYNIIIYLVHFISSSCSCYNEDCLALRPFINMVAFIRHVFGTLMLWVRISLMRGVLDTTLCDKVCQWLAEGQWFSPSAPVSFTNKTDNDIAEILLKVVLNTINLPHS